MCSCRLSGSIQKTHQGSVPLQKVLVGAHLCDGPIGQHQDPVSLGQDVQRVCYKDPSRTLEQSTGPDDLFEDLLADVGIQRCQGVIQQVDGSLFVHSPSQAQPLLLAPRKIHALLPYWGVNSCREAGHIRPQGTGI